MTSNLFNARLGLSVGITPTTVIDSSGNGTFGTVSGTTFTGTSFNSITGLSTASPLMDGTATVGTSTLAAREGHIHPTDTSKANTNQTFYLGTTSVAINRSSSAIVLTGITSIDGSSASCTGNAATVTTNANLTGDVTSVGNATTLTAATVTGKALTGFVLGTDGTALSATDTILAALEKLQVQVNTLQAQLTRSHSWNG